MAANDKRDKSTDAIDLDEVARLVDALERDLARVRGGSRDMLVLRDEVETLKNILNSPIRRHHWVREGLQATKQSIEDGLDAAKAEGLKAGQYLAEIGRILGM